MLRPAKPLIAENKHTQTMRQAELDIVTADGKRYNDTIEIDSNADLTDKQLYQLIRKGTIHNGVSFNYAV